MAKELVNPVRYARSTLIIVTEFNGLKHLPRQSHSEQTAYNRPSDQCNVLDRNLAIQALVAKPLPDQVLPYDENDGAGFWWANNLNVFTRNVAVDCDQHGYRFEVEESDRFKPQLMVSQFASRLL